MNREDYQARKRALDERLASSIDVLRAAHRIEHRALDFLWLSSPDNPEPAASPTISDAAAPIAAVARPPQAPPRPHHRWRFVDLQDRLLELLDLLPDEFTRDDVLHLMKDAPPERSMLFRALDGFSFTGELQRISIGSGRNPTVYRRAAAPSDDGTQADASDTGR